jgi:hypothetical protein
VDSLKSGYQKQVPTPADFRAMRDAHDAVAPGPAHFRRDQGGGEFYPPRSVVKLLVEMIEPYSGRTR